MLGSGEWFGEDFILESAKLRRDAIARALTFVEVVHINHETLGTILEQHPVEYLEIRRAVVRLALLRALLREKRIRGTILAMKTAEQRYSLRIKKIKATGFDETSAWLFAKFTIDRPKSASDEVMESESTAPTKVKLLSNEVMWKGEILDFNSIRESTMHHDLRVEVK